MDLKILPNEVYATEFGALIRTRCPVDRITDLMIHQRVLAMNLSAGDTLKVQCFNHQYSTVYYYSEYLVVDRSEEMRRIEVNDRDTRQVEDVKFSVMQITPWKPTTYAPQKSEEKSEGTSGATVKWNPGLQMYQVKVGDEVVGEHRDKDEAHKIAEQAA